MLLLALLACDPDELDAFLEVDADADADADADSDVDTDTDSDADTDVGPAWTGTVTFQAPPPVCDFSGCRLDYANPRVLPVRHHRIALLDGQGSILTEGFTDTNGGFRLVYDGPEASGTLQVWAHAELPGEAASVTVTDNTDGIDWGAELGTIDLSAPTGGNDFLIEHGYQNGGYQHRASGPFAVSDSVLQATEAWLAVRPTGSLPHLTVFWSPENRPESGDEALGQIGTSFWRESEDAIYLLGAADIDTDEFDRHVMLHEWTHSFQDRASRSDGPGGSHPYGAILDPRTAWSEGSATVMAVMIEGGAYIDTTGVGQQDGFDNDIEDDSGAVPGWWSERAVQRWGKDAFDSTNEPGDTVSLSMADLWGALEGEADEPALATLFSFANRVAEAHPGSAGGLDALSTRFGLQPVQDAFGTGETADGGWTYNLPVYTPITSTPTTLHLDGTLTSNRLGRHRFVRFTGTGGTVTVTATSQEDVDLRLFHRGDQLDSARNYCTSPPCTETVSAPTTAGEDYVVVVEGYGDGADYTADVRTN